MAAVPEDERLQSVSPPKLGAILVERGLLTEEQLAAALAESQMTGQPTGEVIVKMGYATPATIAQALATQHGAPLKTEYGYAVGFGGSSPNTAVGPPPVSPVPAQDAPSAAAAPVSAVRAAPSVEAVQAPAPTPAAAEPGPDYETLARRWHEHAQQVTAQRDAALRQVQALTAQLEGAAPGAAAESEAVARERDEAIARTTQLERELEELKTATTRAAELEATATVLEVERSRLEAAVAQSESVNSELQRKLDDLGVEMSNRESELATALARVAELEATTLSGGHERDQLEAAKAHVAELEATATVAEVERSKLEHALVRAEAGHVDSQRRVAELTRELDARAGELDEAQARITELEAAWSTDENERDSAFATARAEAAQIERARHELASRNAELEQRIEELDSAQSTLREEAARIGTEKAALEGAHKAMTARNADLEERVKELERRLDDASAQITHLEAERHDVLEVARTLGEQRRSLPHDRHAEDSAHLLFVPGRKGYKLVEHDGPPPAPGSIVELSDDEGEAVRLLVAKVAAAPFPGERVACAYLVDAA